MSGRGVDKGENLPGTGREFTWVLSLPTSERKASHHGLLVFKEKPSRARTGPGSPRTESLSSQRQERLSLQPLTGFKGGKEQREEHEK